jgi:hypothetical protein
MVLIGGAEERAAIQWDVSPFNTAHTQKPKLHIDIQL